MKILCSLLLFLVASTSFTQPLWMKYPSISPDGTQIAFSYKGDIYIVASSGGTAIPITIEKSYESYPVWSNNGKMLAYTSDSYGNHDVFLHNLENGNVNRLTYHSSNDYPNAFSNDDKSILFNSWRVDIPKYAQFPNSRMPELYAISVDGGTPKTILTTPSEEVSLNASGNKIYYQDRKGYEDSFRKHHVSSIARDIWMYDNSTNKHFQLTTFPGEDRDPELSKDGNALYYLSEESGSFNVHRIDLANTDTNTQITSFSKYPVRSLSISNGGKLCFDFNGEIFTMEEGMEPQKLKINILSVRQNRAREMVSISSGISELAISSNGKEFVFVKRGEIFVSSVEKGTTKRITNTGTQERSVSFSPDGKSILYAGEKDGSWNIYQTKIVNEEEAYFFNATVLKEEALVSTSAQEFQPVFSPDGKKVAFLENRTTLKVIDLASKKTQTLLPAINNYSYSDGDISFSWSPDSKWIAADMLKPRQWTGEIGVINLETKEVINITNSGYSDSYPRWSPNGEMIYWFSNRDGMKNHGSWGSENDVYAFLLTQQAYDVYNLSKEEKTLFDERNKEKEKEEEVDKKKNDKGEKEESEELIEIEFNDLKKRKERLTIHSSRLADAVVSKNGETLYYLARFEKGVDLWKTNLRTKETKLLTKLGANGGNLILDDEGKNLFVLANGKAHKIDVKKGSKKGLSFRGEMELKKSEEYSYMFDHMWQQVKDKFYVEDLHGVKWDELRENYRNFLPHVTNNYDFAEVMSELLGELNASHTGCRYRPSSSMSDQTGSLGLFFDENYSGSGFKVVEVLEDGPCDKSEFNIEEGEVLTAINGIVITDITNIYDLLNRSVGNNVRLAFNSGKYEIVIKPISRGAEYNLLYSRWVKNRKKEVEEASEGRIGYVHVRGMNNSSFRTVYEEVLGENYDKESLIVDTRSNGGGWLHDDLATFLSGKPYIQFYPRGQDLGNEPQFKWTKPSVVLIGESNYSDAHMFPYTYKALGVGSTVGMPVPGTGTAVWWERQIDPTIVFGIPQVGMVDVEGDYLENKQFEPDYKIKNSYEMLVQGKDEQLRKAVEVLTSQKAKKPSDVKIESVEGKK